MDVPIQTRCPSCAAAVPSFAAWCSLCHADLRPETERPDPAAPVVVADAVQVALPPDPEPEAGAPAGRHAATGAVPAVRTGSSGGRHAARRSLVGASASSAPSSSPSMAPSSASAPSSSSRLAPPAPEDLVRPHDDDVTPDQVDALAEQMLARLAVAEPRDRLLDPRALPGGVWAFSAACALGAVVLFVVVANVLGLFLNR